MEQKVKIKFMQSLVYEKAYYVQFDEVDLLLRDAVDLVNSEVAVITHVYEQ